MDASVLILMEMDWPLQISLITYSDVPCGICASRTSYGRSKLSCRVDLLAHRSVVKSAVILRSAVCPGEWRRRTRVIEKWLTARSRRQIVLVAALEARLGSTAEYVIDQACVSLVTRSARAKLL